MRLVSWISMALVATGFSALASAQIIGGVAANPSTVRVGEPVTVTAHVDIVGGNHCGFAVFYGDGKHVESYSDIKKPMPFVTTHVYDKPGSYTISMGGRHVESHSNCGGGDKFATVTVTEAAKPAMAMPPKITGACSAPWKLSGKVNAKTGAFTCVAKAKTALPETKAVCPGDLTYFENAKKGQFGCRP